MSQGNPPTFRFKAKSQGDEFSCIMVKPSSFANENADEYPVGAQQDGAKAKRNNPRKKAADQRPAA